MSGFRSPLDAYREDLSRAPGRSRLAADDEFWIILATGLRRISQASLRSRPAASRRLATALVTLRDQVERMSRGGANGRVSQEEPTTGRAIDVADALRRFPAPDATSTLITEIRATAADAEEAGGLLLAREMLTDLIILAPHATPLDRGLVLLQLGRIARTLGELETARDLVVAAGDLGRQTGTRELEVREAIAQAVLARTRGNHPAARAYFQAAADGASELGLVDVSGFAHHGLMIQTAETGDFDAALRHGWQALSAARSQAAREAEMLTNLAKLCEQAGYPEAALGGYTAVLARTTVPRLRLPALAGTASAAGRIGDASRVALAERHIAAEASDAFPFETSRAWLAVGRARRALGDTAAADAATTKAAAIARAHGFHEISHRAEQETAPARAPLSQSGLEVIRTLETWSDDPLPGRPVSTSPTG
jgi:hypothetical protein